MRDTRTGRGPCFQRAVMLKRCKHQETAGARPKNTSRRAAFSLQSSAGDGETQAGSRLNPEKDSREQEAYPHQGRG